MHPNTHHHGGTHDDDRGSHDDVRRNCAFDRRNFDDRRVLDDDHVCARHDDCRLVHRRHRSTGWWFQYHVHTTGTVLAVDHNGTSYGH